MAVPVQVTFRDLPVSDAVEADCWREAEKLERFYDRISSCRVVVAETHHRRDKRKLFQIRIALSVPGREIVVNREPPSGDREEAIDVAVRKAFHRLRRRLLAQKPTQG